MLRRPGGFCAQPSATHRAPSFLWGRHGVMSSLRAGRRRRSDVTCIAFGFPSSKRRPTWMQLAGLVIASWAAAIVMDDHAGAASSRNERAVASVARAPGEPIMAIVSLRTQPTTVYY